MSKNITDVNTARLQCWVELGLPARIDAQQVGKALGFKDHDISTLAARGLLKPLGKPAQNAPKYFATVEIMGLAVDEEWLNKATKQVSTCWQEKRQRRASSKWVIKNGKSTNPCGTQATQSFRKQGAEIILSSGSSTVNRQEFTPEV